MITAATSTGNIWEERSADALIINPIPIEHLLAECDFAAEPSKEEMELDQVEPVEGEI